MQMDILRFHETLAKTQGFVDFDLLEIQPFDLLRLIEAKEKFETLGKANQKLEYTGLQIYREHAKWLRENSLAIDTQLKLRRQMIALIKAFLKEAQAQGRLDNLPEASFTGNVSSVFSEAAFRSLHQFYLGQYFQYFEEALVRKTELEEIIQKKGELFTHTEQREKIDELYSRHHLPFNKDQLLAWIKERIGELAAGKKNLQDQIQSLFLKIEEADASRDWAQALQLTNEILAVQSKNMRAAQILEKFTHNHDYCERFSQLTDELDAAIRNKSWEQGLSIRQNLNDRLNESILRPHEISRFQELKTRLDRAHGDAIYQQEYGAVHTRLKTLMAEENWIEAKAVLDKINASFPGEDHSEDEKIISQNLYFIEQKERGERAEKNKAYEEAIQHYQRAVNAIADPDLERRIVRLKQRLELADIITKAQKYRDRKEWAPALELYRQICSKIDDPMLSFEMKEVKEELEYETMVAKGNELIENGAFEKAYDLFQKIYQLKWDPAMKAMVSQIAAAAQEEYNKSIFKKYLQNIHRFLKAGDGKTALQLIPKAMKLGDPGQIAELKTVAESYVRHGALVQEGNRLAGERSWKQALECYREALSIFRTNSVEKAISDVKNELSFAEKLKEFAAYVQENSFDKAQSFLGRMPEEFSKRKPMAELIQRLYKSQERQLQQNAKRLNMKILIGGLVLTIIGSASVFILA